MLLILRLNGQGHTMVTNYVYNSLNQITRQYTPDGDTVKSFYDILGRNCCLSE